jgi:DNA-binding transcriptional ArsR family regulator
VGGLNQVRVLAHPLRLKLLEVFARGPATTKQVARLLGESPTRLYHHVYALERVGLVRLVETKPNRGTVEKYYRTVSGAMAIPVGSGGPVARSLAAAGLAPHGGTGPTGTPRAAARATATRLLEMAEREFAAATTPAAVRARDPAPLLARLVVRGDEARIQRIRAELLRWIAEIGANAAATPGGAPDHAYALTLAFLPASEAAAAGRGRGRKPRATNARARASRRGR